MRAKTDESPSIKSKMDDVAEAVAAVKRDLDLDGLWLFEIAVEHEHEPLLPPKALAQDCFGQPGRPNDDREGWSGFPSKTRQNRLNLAPARAVHEGVERRGEQTAGPQQGGTVAIGLVWLASIGNISRQWRLATIWVMPAVALASLALGHFIDATGKPPATEPIKRNHSTSIMSPR